MTGFVSHSFCESVTATAISPWCIRPLTDLGRKLSGGVDTNSLCGRVRKPYGWDLGVQVVGWDHPKICPKCKAILISQREKALDELTEQAQELDMGY